MSGDTLPRAIGVPCQRAFVWVLAIGLALGVQIGESIQFWKSIGMVLVHHMDLNFTKTLSQLHLLGWRNILRWKQKDLVLQERLVNAGKDFGCHFL